MWVTKLLISQVKKMIFCPKTTKFGPKLAFLVILGQALPAHFALLVGWLVVMARGLYLARHLFTYLLNLKVKTLKRNCIIGILGHPLLAVLELRDCLLSHMGKSADWDTQILILGCIYICSTLYVLYCDQAVAPMFTYSVQLTFSTIYF